MTIKQNSIKKRLVQNVLLISVFIIVVITAFETYVSFRNNLSQLDKVDSLVKETLLQPLIEAVWLLDHNDIVLHMGLVLSQPNVEMIQLKIEQGKTITVGEINSAKKKTYTYKLDYKHNNKTLEIGSLSVFAGLDPIYSQTQIQTITNLFGNSVIVFFVAFFIVFLTKNLITRHLVDISNDLVSLKSNSIEVLDITLNRKKSNSTRGDELENVVDAINSMRTALVASYEEIHESQKRLSQITDNSEMWVWEVDKEGLYTYCSDACEHMFGYLAKEIVGGKYFYDFFHPEDKEYLKKSAFEVFEKRTPFKEFINRNVNRLGDTVWLSTTGCPIIDNNGNLIGYRGADIDISKRIKLMEDQARASQLAALGTVAAGVAHEINNPIQGILNYAGLIEKHPERTDRNLKISKRIKDESLRIAKITQDLLFYSKDSRVDMKLVDVGGLVENALSLIATKMRHDLMDLEIIIQKDLPKLLIQPQSIQQVVINLVNNACDALRYKEELVENKQIRVSVGLFEDDGEQRLSIEVYDNGIGMSEKVMKRSQEAFFTTKPPAEGTGLGLSIVNDIIKKHNGHIDIESKENEYTIIKIVLPAVAEVGALD